MIFKNAYTIPKEHLHLYTEERIKEVSVKNMVSEIVKYSELRNMGLSGPTTETFETKIALMPVNDYIALKKHLQFLVKLYPGLQGLAQLISKME